MLITYTEGVTMSEDMKDKFEVISLVSIFVISVMGIVQ